MWYVVDSMTFTIHMICSFHMHTSIRLNAFQTSQFLFWLSIVVTLRGQEHFRGFFIQARDAETNEWIGSWQDSQNTKTIPECASITHADPKDKEGANLIWNAPQHKSGRVYFT